MYALEDGLVIRHTQRVLQSSCLLRARHLRVRKSFAGFFQCLWHGHMLLGFFALHRHFVESSIGAWETNDLPCDLVFSYELVFFFSIHVDEILLLEVFEPKDVGNHLVVHPDITDAG